MFGFSNKSNLNKNVNNNAGSNVNSKWNSLRSGQNNTVNQWDALRNSENNAELEKAKQDKQRDKLSLALLSGNAEYFAGDEANISDRDREGVIDLIADGAITVDDEKRMISRIAPPIATKGVNAVASVIAQNRHESTILNYMLGVDGDRFATHYIDAFMNQFPTPFDFEQKKQSFLNMIEANNSTAKYQEYVRDMNAFCKDIYGKRQEYYERALELNDEAKKRRTDKLENVNKRENTIFNAETEAKMQSPFVEKGSVVFSKADLRGEKNGKPGGDAIYEDVERGVMALFDGVGSTIDDAAASNACKNSLKSLMEQVDFTSEAGRQELVERLNSQLTSEDATTCVVSQTVKNPDGTSTLHYVSVGDSRLYVIREGQAMQISRDDSITEEMLDRRGIRDAATRKSYLLHGISNCLGSGFTGRISSGNNGSLLLYPGDRILLCSDGITGDVKESDLDQNDRLQGKTADAMSDVELAQIVSRSRNCREAALNLAQNARKVDDRSAILAQV